MIRRTSTSNIEHIANLIAAGKSPDRMDNRVIFFKRNQLHKFTAGEDGIPTIFSSNFASYSELFSFLYAHGVQDEEGNSIWSSVLLQGIYPNTLAFSLLDSGVTMTQLKYDYAVIQVVNYEDRQYPIFVHDQFAVQIARNIYYLKGVKDINDYIEPCAWSDKSIGEIWPEFNSLEMI
jgi:hypothetical protein